jgi:hypothetical protein
VVFIKMEMVPPLKFHPKLNGSPHQQQSNVAMCHIINFVKKKLKNYIFSKKKK